MTRLTWRQHLTRVEDKLDKLLYAQGIGQPIEAPPAPKSKNTPQAYWKETLPQVMVPGRPMHWSAIRYALEDAGKFPDKSLGTTAFYSILQALHDKGFLRKARKGTYFIPTEDEENAA